MKTASKRSSRASAPNSYKKAAGYTGVISLAASTADSLDAILRKIDGEVFRELKAIAAHIETLPSR
jgi:hypothetical protein